MIFGFNTDVKYGDTVYHVQSEARANDLLLQTQVFVKGRCIGKRATSYADSITQPGFSEESMHEMLKNQHRLVLDAVKDGKAEGIISLTNEIQDVDGNGLSIRWLNPETTPDGKTVTMKFVVTDSSNPVAGAKVISRPFLASDAQLACETTTREDGSAEMVVTLDEHGIADSSVMIQALAGDKKATRKFRWKKGSSATA
jgi:hypothetical protein